MRLRRPVNLIALAWLPFAAWLALWPAAEARQLPARAQAVRTTASAMGGCCRSSAPERPAFPQGGERHGCCAERCETPARPPACPEGGNARCTQCFSQTGLLLFTQLVSVPDPERTMLGAILNGDHVAASRDLRPPVPPPRRAGAPQYS